MWMTTLVAALISAPPAGDPSAVRAGGPLDATAIASRAAATSPGVRAAEAGGDAAAARTRLVDRRFWPRIVTSARYTRISPTDPTAIEGLPVPVAIPGPVEDQLAVGLQVALPLSDWVVRWDAARAAGHQAEAAERALAEAARRKAAADALILYWQVQRARLGQGVAQSALAEATSHLEAAQALLRADAGSIADVRLAEAGVAAARGDVERAAHAEALARRALTTALHLPDVGAEAIVADDAGDPAAADITGGEAGLVAEALAARPEARAIAAGEAALAAEGRLADAGRWPRLDVVANAQIASPSPRGLGYDDTAVALWDASLVASWSPNALWDADAEDGERAARGVRFAADRQALADGIALEVASALRDRADADAAARASQAMLAAAEEAQRVRARAYAVGKASSLELSDAEQQLARARAAIVDARIGGRIADVRLRHALGRPL